MNIVSLKTRDFDGLTNLQNLSFRNNSLSFLPEGVFDNTPELQELYLNGNDLVSLPAGVFDNLGILRFGYRF